jgi:uncharacterized repeat protein (TIGR03803 family)
MDASGNLYGATREGGDFLSVSCFFCSGTVFELSPPSTIGGEWTESILWSFGNGTDGANVVTDPIFDNRGNLYGVTASGGAFGDGTAFEMSPPSTIGEDWTESILWSFAGGSIFGGTDGKIATRGMIFDAGGNFYGTTEEGGRFDFGGLGGTVFELTPPSTSGGNWTESVLWAFGQCFDGARLDAGLILDKSGNLYGTTYYGGSNFSDGNGHAGQGTAFELTPPSSSGGKWTEAILWNFGGTDGQHPQAGLTMDAGGSLYGTTCCGGAFGKGTVFEISPPANVTPTTTLTASPNKLSFGNIHVNGTGKPKKVTLTNKGTAAAQIVNVTAPAAFLISGDTCLCNIIAPQDTCSFVLKFAPTKVGNVNGGIDVTYNGTSPVVALKGKGIAMRKSR